MALFKQSRNKKAINDKAPSSSDISEDVVVYAKGSAGEVKTYTVDDRTTAIAMAIVAEQTDIPLNQLKFISIKEIEA